MTTTVKETLYDIGEARQILETWFSETEGEVTPDLAELEKQLDGKEAEKVERIALFICEEEHRSAAIKAEEQKLAARRKAIDRKIEWLKDSYLRGHLERREVPKIQGVLKTVSLQTNPPSVKPTAGATEYRGLFPTLVRVIPEICEWDKKAMLEAWKADPKALEGIAIVDSSTSVRIR